MERFAGSRAGASGPVRECARREQAMGSSDLDGLLRGGAIALYLLLFLLFARDWKRSLVPRLGALLTASAAAYVALTIVDARFDLPAWRWPLYLMGMAAPGLFWLFAAAWFNDGFVVRRRHWAAVVALVLFGALGNAFRDVPGARVIGLGWRIGSLAAVAAALVIALRGRDGDLVEPRRRARLILAVLTALGIGWVLAAEMQLRHWPPPIGWQLGNAVVMLTLAAVPALVLLGWRDAGLIAPVPPEAPAPVALPDDSALLARLDAEMRRERLYRKEGLTITSVAAHLNVPEYRLRRAINQGLGARNFNAYLNRFRVDEAAAALGDREQREVPILTIALDAGFGSMAPFNRAFREAHGSTPSAYRMRALQD